MPYIKPEYRPRLDKHINALAEEIKKSQKNRAKIMLSRDY
jgi:hypothetical protein